MNPPVIFPLSLWESAGVRVRPYQRNNTQPGMANGGL
jgi:hypothetical protein